MEPVTIAAALKVLGKVFSVGLAAYKVRREGGMNADGACSGGRRRARPSVLAPPPDLVKRRGEGDGCVRRGA